MPTRNTGILNEIIYHLGSLVINQPEALAQLKNAFKGKLLIVAGNVETVAKHAEELRLAIDTTECETVLDYIGTASLAGITIDHVEETINTLFPGRFIEPEN